MAKQTVNDVGAFTQANKDAINADFTELYGTSSPLVSGVGTGYKVARGVAAITNAGSGVATVVTGLTTVVAVVAQLATDLTTTCEAVTATIGDQAGSPAAGSIILKGWKTLGGTPVAMTTTTVDCNWVAFGV